MELAGPIAERGATAVPFLMNQLNRSADDSAVRDILLIFERMQTSGSYNVKGDSHLMGVLTSKVSAMRDRGRQDTCQKMLLRIQDSK